MKICTKCGINQAEIDFPTRRAQCKGCRSIINAQNKAIIGPEYFKKKGAQHYIDNREERCLNSKLYREQHKEEIAAHQVQYRLQNHEAIIEYETQWRKENQDWIDKWNAENKDRTNAISARRRAAKLNATPAWLTEEHFKQMQRYYTVREWVQSILGENIEVDHIEPLQGENVRGLHVPWNLQLLTELENIRKGNKS